MDVSAASSFRQAIEAARAGDTTGLKSLPQELVIEASRSTDVVPSLIALCNTTTSNVVISVSWKQLAPIASDAACPRPTYRVIADFMLQKLRHALIGTDWSEAVVIKTARFFAAHFSTIVRAQPSHAASTISSDVIDLYMDLHCATSLAPSAATDDVRTNIMPRLEVALAAMAAAESAEASARTAMMSRCVAGAAPRSSAQHGTDGPARAAACLAATLALLRDAHRFTGSVILASPLSVLKTLLLWLPGMSHALPPADGDELQVATARLASQLPDEAFGDTVSAAGSSPLASRSSILQGGPSGALDGAAASTTSGGVSAAGIARDSSPLFHSWGLVAARLVAHVPPSASAELLATLVAAAFVPSARSLERVQWLLGVALQLAERQSAAIESLVGVVVDGIAPASDNISARLAAAAISNAISSACETPLAGVSAAAQRAVRMPVTSHSWFAAAWLASLTCCQRDPSAHDALLEYLAGAILLLSDSGGPSDYRQQQNSSPPPPMTPSGLISALPSCTAAVALLPLEATQRIASTPTFHGRVSGALAIAAGPSPNPSQQRPLDSAVVATAIVLPPAELRLPHAFMDCASRMLIPGGVKPQSGSHSNGVSRATLDKAGAGLAAALRLRFVSASHRWATEESARRRLVELRSACANSLLRVGESFTLAYSCAEALQDATQTFGTPVLDLGRSSFDVLAQCLNASQSDRPASAGPAPAVSDHLVAALLTLQETASMVLQQQQRSGGGGAGGQRKRKRDVETALEALAAKCAEAAALVAASAGQLSPEELAAAARAHEASTALMRLLHQRGGAAGGGSSSPLEALRFASGLESTTSLGRLTHTTSTAGDGGAAHSGFVTIDD